MKRKFLEDLGIADKDVIDKIIDENSKDIGAAKGENETLKQKVLEKETEITTLKGQISERDKQLETLKNSPDNPEELKKQLEQVQKDNKAAKEKYEADMKQLKVNHAVDNILKEAGAKNVTAVKALLKELDKAELDESGNVKGLKEQIEALTKADDTSFLFDTKALPEMKGAKPGEPQVPASEIKPDFSKMSYEQIAAYMEANPTSNN